jgi:hypothetical protein
MRTYLRLVLGLVVGLAAFTVTSAALDGCALRAPCIESLGMGTDGRLVMLNKCTGEVWTQPLPADPMEHESVRPPARWHGEI